MAYLYPEELFPEVKAAIGDSASAITDATLRMNVYKGEAERFIMSQLTEAQYTDVALKSGIDAAATLYLASIVAPTIRAVSSERVPGGDMSFESANLAALAIRLREQAEDAIAKIVTASGTDAPPFPYLFVFTTAKRRF